MYIYIYVYIYAYAHVYIYISTTHAHLCNGAARLLSLGSLSLHPASSASAPRVPKNKNSEVARRHPDGLGTEYNTQSFSGC